MPLPMTMKSGERYTECYPTIRVSMPPVRIDVATPSRSYTVALDDNALDRIGLLLDGLKVPARRFVVSSPLVWRLHGARFSRGARGIESILVPDGERYKQLV